MIGWQDSELVSISALEHWSYCPRQCALIYIEQTFEENLYTLRGNDIHARVDIASTDIEEGVRTVRSLPLWSDRLGLIGRADVVEFYGNTPFPIEYKSGKRRKWGHDELQLCAQAICLEEMLAVSVPSGAIHYHGSRRHLDVTFTELLRKEVEEAVVAIRNMMKENQLPPPANDARCLNCSLIQSCMPTVSTDHSPRSELHRRLFVVSNSDSSD